MSLSRVTRPAPLQLKHMTDGLQSLDVSAMTPEPELEQPQEVKVTLSPQFAQSADVVLDRWNNCVKVPVLREPRTWHHRAKDNLLCTPLPKRLPKAEGVVKVQKVKSIPLHKTAKLTAKRDKEDLRRARDKKQREACLSQQRDRSKKYASVFQLDDKEEEDLYQFLQYDFDWDDDDYGNFYQLWQSLFDIPRSMVVDNDVVQVKNQRDSIDSFDSVS